MKLHTYALTAFILGSSLLFSSGTALAEEGEIETMVEMTEDEASEDAGTKSSDKEKSETEPEITKISQGLYEIASITSPDFVLDARHCTINETEKHPIQLFRSMDVNQQKFYIESVPKNRYRFSLLCSGEALTFHGETNFSLGQMEHPEGTGVSDSQAWTLRKAGKDAYYIQVPSGLYLTLDAIHGYSGAKVVLSEFTGERNQQWIFTPTWISETDIADTDLVNPYGPDGECKRLKLLLRFGKDHIYLTADELAEHMIETEEHTLKLEDGYISDYIASLAEKYNTQGQPRRFITTPGKEITLTEGDFGWKLDTDATTSAVREHLEDTRFSIIDPVWAHTGPSDFSASDINDIGNSYIEVDLTRQKVWLYQNGEQILETDCVSGTHNTDRQTITGVYSIYYMQSPAVLNGPDYSSPVDYWMPFHGGYGLHDANWRSEFGGEIYKSNGSHGCVNLPTESAKLIYETVSKGWPVIVYY